MIIRSEAEMLEFGRNFAKSIQIPAIIELIGDVGAGKTTFTRGLAEGLGIAEPVTSPSFTISKRYTIPANFSTKSRTGSEDQSSLKSQAESFFSNSELVHYDFYRLSDPGIMADEIAETIASPQAITVIEWAGDVANILPAQHIKIEIFLQEDGSRQVILNDDANFAIDDINSSKML